jgi:predicted transcriptional regulator
MAVLGELEMQVMGQLWADEKPLSVRAIHEVLSSERELAYTTVMTVLDRLAKKGLVLREQEGRAWLYRPAVGLAELVAAELVRSVQDAGDEADSALLLFAGQLNEQQRRALAGHLCTLGEPG